MKLRQSGFHSQIIPRYIRRQAEDGHKYILRQSDWERLVAFYMTPRALWKKLRTKECHRESLQRRMTISCFNNTESIEKIVFAVMSHLNENWMDTTVYEFTQNY